MTTPMARVAESSLHVSPSTRAVQAPTAGPGSPHPVEPTPIVVSSSGPGPASPAEWLEDLYDQARTVGHTTYPRGTLTVLSLLLWTATGALGVSLLAAVTDRLIHSADDALSEVES